MCFCVCVCVRESLSERLCVCVYVCVACMRQRVAVYVCHGVCM